MVAVGKFGGGVVIEVRETNKYLDIDVNDLGAYIEDLFAEGTEPPKEAGVYLFKGKTRLYYGEWFHRGVFEPMGPVMVKGEKGE